MREWVDIDISVHLRFGFTGRARFTPTRWCLQCCRTFLVMVMTRRVEWIYRIRWCPILCKWVDVDICVHLRFGFAGRAGMTPTRWCLQCCRTLKISIVFRVVSAWWWFRPVCSLWTKTLIASLEVERIELIFRIESWSRLWPKFSTLVFWTRTACICRFRDAVSEPRPIEIRLWWCLLQFLQVSLNGGYNEFVDFLIWHTLLPVIATWGRLTMMCMTTQLGAGTKEKVIVTVIKEQNISNFIKLSSIKLPSSSDNFRVLW